MNRFFKVKDLNWHFDTWLNVNHEAARPHNAAVFDALDDYSKEMIANAEEWALEIHWLPDDQQMRMLGAAELPINYHDPYTENLRATVDPAGEDLPDIEG